MSDKYQDRLLKMQAGATQEHEIEQIISMFAATLGCVLMRNNSGAGYLSAKPGEETSWIRFGLGNISEEMNENLKSSDEIGITSVVITPDMVGQRIGVFTAIEVKRPGWKFSPNNKREVAQKNFIDMVNNAGGYAGFSDSVDSFKKIIGR